MKLFLSFFLIVFAEPIVICQTFGSKQIINPDQSGIRMIRTADFDNDEDMDVVVAAFDFILGTVTTAMAILVLQLLYKKGWGKVLV